MSAAVPEMMHHLNSESFKVKYLGNIVLGRRYTPIILPWVLAEVRRKGEYKCIALNAQRSTHSLEASLLEEGQGVIFKHKLGRLSRFTRAKWNPCCFAYLTREDIEKSPFTCHVFEAPSKEEVSIISGSPKSQLSHLLAGATVFATFLGWRYRYSGIRLGWGCESEIVFFSFG